MSLNSKVKLRSRALRAAVTSAVESLETRRLFAYVAEGLPIENAATGSLLDVVFDVKTIGGVQKVLNGREIDGTATLVNANGTDPLSFAPPELPLGADPVSSFGYDVAFVGDSVVIAAKDASGAIYYVYDYVVDPETGGSYNTAPRALRSPEGADENFYPVIDNFGDHLLVRETNGVYVLDLNLADGDDSRSFLSLPSNFVAGGTDAIDSFGDNILVATHDGTETYIAEIFPAPTSGVLQRRFDLDGDTRRVTLAYGQDGEVFIGDIGAATVKQYGLTTAGLPLLVRTYIDADTVNFGQTLAVSGDHVLIGASVSGADRSVKIFDYTGVSPDPLVDTLSRESGSFGSVAVRSEGGFAISDALAPNGGTIQFFKFEPDAPAGPSAVLDANGNVIVTGTGDADGFIIRVSGGALIVSEGTTQLGSFPIGAGGVTGSVVVNGGAGDDVIGVAPNVNVPIEAYGGAGNDLISGGGAADILVGGEGNDVLVGGGGRDLLIGGRGADIIIGNTEDDILIAGYTSHDGNPGTLRDIMTVWTGGGSFSTRVSNLRTGLLAPDANVEDDDAIDILSGNQGTDWFIFNNDGPGARDLVLDRLTAQERANMDFIPAD